MKRNNEYCENCKFWKCMGYRYYECTNEASPRCGENCSRGDSCNQFKED